MKEKEMMELMHKTLAENRLSRGKDTVHGGGWGWGSGVQLSWGWRPGGLVSLGGGWTGAARG